MKDLTDDFQLYDGEAASENEDLQ